MIIKNNCKRKKRRHGFTLIELMFSILIISIASAGALESINISNRLSIQAKEATIAVADARAVLDKIKVTSLTDLPTDGTLNASTIWTDLNNFISNSLSSEQILITGGSGTSLRQITVSISWIGPGGRTKNLEFSTMKSQFNG